MEFGAGTARVFPSDEMVKSLMESDDPDPIVMVNLLKLKAGGDAELNQYGAGVTPLIQKVGGEWIYMGPVTGNVIGDPDWDIVALVRYPNCRAFAQMVLSQEYAAVAPHRGAALERAELIMTKPAR